MNNNQQSALGLSTESIKIYEKTYQLPVLNSPGFSQLQQKIKKRQKLIKAEKRQIKETQTQKRFFGLFNKVETVTRSQPITFSERFQELESGKEGIFLRLIVNSSSQKTCPPAP